MSIEARKGVVHGRVVQLDSPVPPLEGRRVRVLLESLDEVPLPELDDAWRSWELQGPVGPIEDEDIEGAAPDSTG